METTDVPNFTVHGCVVLVAMLLASSARSRLNAAEPDNDEDLLLIIRSPRFDIMDRLYASEALAIRYDSTVRNVRTREPTAAIRERRKRLGEDLTKIATKSRDSDGVGHGTALRLIGRLRLAESVPYLVGDIEYEIAYFGSINSSGQYPHVQPLIEIGERAVRGIFEYLEKTPSRNVSEKALELYGVVVDCVHQDRSGTSGPAIAIVQRELERLRQDKPAKDEKVYTENILRLLAELRKTAKQ